MRSSFARRRVDGIRRFTVLLLAATFVACVPATVNAATKSQPAAARKVTKRAPKGSLRDRLHRRLQSASTKHNQTKQTKATQARANHAPQKHVKPAPRKVRPARAT